MIRVTRHAAANTKRDPKVSWVFRGHTVPPLQRVSPLYGRRYSAEHGYRVDKQDLLWETPRLRTPEQFQHSTFFGLRGTIAPLLAIPLLHGMGEHFPRAFVVCMSIMMVGLGFQALSLGSYRRVQREEKRDARQDIETDSPSSSD